MKSYYEWIYDTYYSSKIVCKPEKYKGIPVYKSTSPNFPNIYPSIFSPTPPLLTPELSFGPGFMYEDPDGISIGTFCKDSWVKEIMDYFHENLEIVTRQILIESDMFSKKMRYGPPSSIPFNFIYDISKPIDPGLRYISPTLITFRLFPFKLHLTSPYYGTLPSEY